MGRLKLFDESIGEEKDLISDDINSVLESCMNVNTVAAYKVAIITSEEFYRDALIAAMKLTTESTAKTLVQCTVLTMCSLSSMTTEEAMRIFLGDVGYFAGYHSLETRLRVERIFNTSHPILGKSVDKPSWTYDELKEIIAKLEENTVIL